MLKPNIILGDRYQLQQQLNRNHGRETWQASDLFTNKKIVIKFLAFSPQMQWEDLKLFERESEVLKHLKHPQIPKYRDYFSLDKEAGNGLCWLALVQDYIPGKSLEKLLKEGARFSETQIEDIAKQVLEILIYLHQQEPSVIHRDIKPSNIILDEERAYLVDFGAVKNKAAATGLTFTVVGTTGYAPLEQFWGKAIPASDLYALGATIIHLLTGISPGDLIEENLQIQFASLVSLKPHLIGWLKAMTAPDAQQRYQTAEKALDDLRSRNFLECSQETIYSPYSQKILVERSREDLIVQFLGNGGFTTSNILQTLGNLIKFFDALVTYSWSIIVAFLPTAIALLPLWYAWFLFAVSSDEGDLILFAFVAFIGGVVIFGIPYLIVLGMMMAERKKISEFNKKHMEINFEKLQKAIFRLLPNTQHLSFSRSCFISQTKSWGIELKLCQGNTNSIESIVAQEEAIALTYRQKQRLKKYQFGYNLKMAEKEWLATIIKDWGLEPKDIWHLLIEEEQLKAQGSSIKERNETWELEEQHKETNTYNKICQELAKDTTLTEALNTFKRFEGLGQFKGYYLKPWSKNGEARIYVRRKSVPKGFIIINPDGSINTNNCKEFDLTDLKLKVALTNDITAEPTPQNDPYERAIANLNAQFGKDA